MNLGAYAEKIRFLYTDKAEFRRHIATQDENGATRVKYSDVPFLESDCVICHDNTDNASPFDNSHIPKNKTLSLHLPPGLDIRAGDYVKAKKLRGGKIDRMYCGIAGEPVVYPTHVKVTFDVEKAF